LEKINTEKSKKDDETNFVSTNDILTSAFGDVTDARILLMPFNMRDKVSHFDDDDAGN